MSAAFNLGEDSLNAGGPSVGQRVIVPSGEELVDGGVQFGDATKRATSNGLLLKLGEPALDEVEPARTGGDEVQHKARALPQPRTDAFVAVDGIVVQDKMEATWRWELRLNATQEAQELLMTMTRVTLRHDIALTDMQRGKQAGRAMALILMGKCAAAPADQRQTGLCPIQRLDLALFIDA